VQQTIFDNIREELVIIFFRQNDEYSQQMEFNLQGEMGAISSKINRYKTSSIMR
jgi:hypothetical protein